MLRLLLAATAAALPRLAQRADTRTQPQRLRQQRSRPLRRRAGALLGCADETATGFLVDGRPATCAVLQPFCADDWYGSLIRAICPVTCNACTTSGSPFPPSTLRTTAPSEQWHVEGRDFEPFSDSARGTVEGPLVAAGREGCAPSDWPDMTGAVALVQRGRCYFSTKVELAVAAGAAALLVVNTDGTVPANLALLPADESLRLPAMVVSSPLGESLASALQLQPMRVELTVAAPQAERALCDACEAAAVGTVQCARYASQDCVAVGSEAECGAAAAGQSSAVAAYCLQYPCELHEVGADEACFHNVQAMLPAWDRRQREDAAGLCACLGNEFAVVVDERGAAHCRHRAEADLDATLSGYSPPANALFHFVMTCDQLQRCFQHVGFDDAVYLADMAAVPSCGHHVRCLERKKLAAATECSGPSYAVWGRVVGSAVGEGTLEVCGADAKAAVCDAEAAAAMCARCPSALPSVGGAGNQTAVCSVWGPSAGNGGCYPTNFSAAARDACVRDQAAGAHAAFCPDVAPVAPPPHSVPPGAADLCEVCERAGEPTVCVDVWKEKCWATTGREACAAEGTHFCADLECAVTGGCHEVAVAQSVQWQAQHRAHEEELCACLNKHWLLSGRGGPQHFGVRYGFGDSGLSHQRGSGDGWWHCEAAASGDHWDKSTRNRTARLRTFKHATCSDLWLCSHIAADDRREWRALFDTHAECSSHAACLQTRGRAAAADCALDVFVDVAGVRCSSEQVAAYCGTPAAGAEPTSAPTAAGLPTATSPPAAAATPATSPPAAATVPPTADTRPPLAATVPPTPATSPPTPSLPPTLSTPPPTLSTSPPTLSTPPPTLSTSPPTLSTLPPTVYTLPPAAETRPPTAATLLPTAAFPPAAPTLPPTVAAHPPVATLPPTATTSSPTVAALPPTAATLPPTVATLPPTVATLPPTVATLPPTAATPVQRGSPTLQPGQQGPAAGAAHDGAAHDGAEHDVYPALAAAACCCPAAALLLWWRRRRRRPENRELQALRHNTECLPELAEDDSLLCDTYTRMSSPRQRSGSLPLAGGASCSGSCHATPAVDHPLPAAGYTPPPHPLDPSKLQPVVGVPVI